MIVLHDPDTLLHDTVELLGAKTRPALEVPARIKEIVAKVLESHHTLRYVKSPVSDSQDFLTLLNLIRETHGQDYLKHLEDVFRTWRAAKLIEPSDSVLPECFVFSNKARSNPLPPKDIYARAGYFAFDMSSGIMESTYISIISSANLAFQAVQELKKGDICELFALCRPPGHHSDGKRAGGYCYVNNAAVAISTWRKMSPVSRIAILDIDFHHGNGTQEIYYAEPNVFYTSIHGQDEFPYYTGMPDETGLGEGIGKNLNLPLQTGSSFSAYMEKLNLALASLTNFKPEFLLVSLGFDTFYLDPLGNFKIETDDYETIARTIRQALPKIPCVVLLEGGYVLEHLGANVLSFIKGWETV